jgi:hypothetical protein
MRMIQDNSVAVLHRVAAVPPIQAALDHKTALAAPRLNRLDGRQPARAEGPKATAGQGGDKAPSYDGKGRPNGAL